MLIYRKAIHLPAQKNKAAKLAQAVFLSHNWSNTWKNGIYDFHHYHSTTHECMAICAGTATVIFGGPNGRRVKVAQGDVIILPAGVGHKCSAHSEDFLCVGAYPQGKNYDTNTGTSKELEEAVHRIKKLAIPKYDPLFGTEGFLKTYWK